MTASLSIASAAPCRHRGTPREGAIEQVIGLLSAKLGADQAYLERHGLTPEEYTHSLPAAIERLRGRMAAKNQKRRDFVEEIVKLLVETGVASNYQKPRYGKHTIYRVYLKNGIQVGIIQKGCPDGKHSSVAWSRPEWAKELYLWWVCDSKAAEPGEHVWKGVTRLRGKVSLPGEDQLDGLIFFNRLCGTPERPCPKMEHAVERNGVKLPPPCVYVFPHWETGQNNLNWRGEVQRTFPAQLLRAFGILPTHAPNFIGHVGFRLSAPNAINTEITSRYGPAKASTARG
ncbi:MAG: hypothetical protein JWM68_3321 [Verrucomicrobiales bacterium]|nr:hypothetical protein [Verrucomicrobiales bacterium]